MSLNDRGKGTRGVPALTSPTAEKFVTDLNSLALGSQSDLLASVEDSRVFITVGGVRYMVPIVSLQRT